MSESFDTEAQLSLGKRLFEKGNYYSAVPYFQVAGDGSMPVSAEARLYLGRCYEIAGDYDLAYLYYHAAWELMQNDAAIQARLYRELLDGVQRLERIYNEARRALG